MAAGLGGRRSSPMDNIAVDSSRDVDFVGNIQATSKSLKVVVGAGETWGLMQRLMKAHPGSRVGC